MESTWNDLRHALRALRRQPGFTAIAALTLALGIGLTTAVFSLVNAILVRPLPYADGERLVLLRETLRDQNGNASPGHFRDWSNQATTLEAVAALQPTTYNLTEAGEPQRLRAARVTQDYFRVASIPPLLGRYFNTDDGRHGRAVVVLGELLWTTRFAGDRAIVGRTVRLNGEPFTVIGVAPAAYALINPTIASGIGGFGSQAWTLLTFTPAQLGNYGAHNLPVIAKLKQDASLASAQADLERITRDIAVRQPDQMAARWVRVESLATVVTSNVRTPLMLLLAAVVVVLVVGCVNIAGLLLARAAGRQREIAIRASLGGNVSRLLRQLFAESVVIAALGGIVGLLVAQMAIRFFVEQGPANTPRLESVGLQPAIVLFAIGITGLVAIVCGVAPALRAVRIDLQSALQPVAGSSSAVSRDRLRSALAIAEIGLTAVLLVVTGLLARSAFNLQRVPFGFAADNVLTSRLALPIARYPGSETVVDAYSRVLEQVRGIQGVSSVAVSTDIPLTGSSVDVGITAEGRTFAPEATPSPHLRLVSDGFFGAFGMTVIRGRGLQASDMANGAVRVLVINERLATLLWPGENAIGKHISGWTAGPEPEWREVVGIVADVRSFGRNEPAQPEMFLPFTQAPDGAWDVFQRTMVLAVRTAASPETYAAALRTAVARVDSSLPLFDIRTLETIVGNSLATRRFYTRLISVLSISGLFLALLGLYGVISYFVEQRRLEIGIRVALGAARRAVVGMVLRQGLATGIAGTSLGLAAALFLTRPMRDLLFEVEPGDPQTFAAAGALLIAAALLACCIPAMRAARVNPTIALRSE